MHTEYYFTDIEIESILSESKRIHIIPKTTGKNQDSAIGLIMPELNNNQYVYLYRYLKSKFFNGKVNCLIKLTSKTTADMSIISEIESTVLNIKNLQLSESNLDLFIKNRTESDIIYFMLYQPEPFFPIIDNYKNEENFHAMQFANVTILPFGT